MKWKLWLIVLLSLAVLGGGIVFVLFKYQFHRQPSQTSYSRQQLSKFKGIWPAPGDEDFLIASLSEVKDLGVNIVPVVVPFCVKGNKIEPIVYGPPWRKFQQEAIIKQRIEKIHQAGLAVELDLGTLSPRCETEIQNKDNFITQFPTYVQKWAKIAEEYQVELFSPLNEPNFVLRGRESEFAQKVLPLIKQVYTGDVVLKVADVGSENINYSGYDYVAFDVYTNSIAEWPQQLEIALSKMEEVVKTYRLKGGFFGETGAITHRDPHDPLLAGGVFTPEEQAQFFEIFFQNAWDKTAGVFIMTWAKSPTSPYNIRHQPAEKVVRKWFRKF